MKFKEILNWLILQILYVLSWVFISNFTTLTDYLNLSTQNIIHQLLYIIISISILYFYQSSNNRNKYIIGIGAILSALILISLIPYIILIFTVFLLLRFFLASLPVITFFAIPILILNFILVIYNVFYLGVSIDEIIINPKHIFIILTSELLVISFFYQYLKRISFLPYKDIFKFFSKSRKMAIQSLQLHNVRGLIYLFFFVFLVVYSFMNLDDLNNISILKSSNHDRAILQSFLCYLAMDRVLLHAKNNKLKPSVFLDNSINEFKITKSIIQSYQMVFQSIKKIFKSNK